MNFYVNYYVVSFPLRTLWVVWCIPLWTEQFGNSRSARSWCWTRWRVIVDVGVITELCRGVGDSGVRGKAVAQSNEQHL